MTKSKKKKAKPISKKVIKDESKSIHWNLIYAGVLLANTVYIFIFLWITANFG